MNKRTYNLQNQSISLSKAEVHIWNFNLDRIRPVQNRLDKILSNDELVRGNKFHFDIDKDRYICSRGLLRILLGIYTDIPSNQINFTFNEYGKPYLLSDQNNNDLHFNLSHSKNFMSVGFVKNALIGMDVELMKPFKDHLEIARRFFSAKTLIICLPILPNPLIPTFTAITTFSYYMWLYFSRANIDIHVRSFNE